MKFSLLFFAAAEDDSRSNRYNLLLSAARRADAGPLTAVWLPERHFAEFGGDYPNPSVLAGAIAVLTSRIRLRAGSVIAPLHDPLRVAEEWAVVDNLSKGRAEISFGSGWNVNDFVLAPNRYDDRRGITYDSISAVQRLWRGESVCRQNGAGKTFEVRTLPRPIQPELPVWLTAQSDQTFRNAGAAGYGVLTNLNFNTPEVTARRVGLYRDACQESGAENHCRVALMLHTYLAASQTDAHAIASPALRRYLASNLDLRSQFTAGKRGESMHAGADQDLSGIIDNGIARIYDWAGLIGSADSVAPNIERFAAMGINELACLIDFGIDQDAVIDGIERIGQLAEKYASVD